MPNDRRRSLPPLLVSRPRLQNLLDSTPSAHLQPTSSYIHLSACFFAVLHYLLQCLGV